MTGVAATFQNIIASQVLVRILQNTNFLSFSSIMTINCVLPHHHNLQSLDPAFERSGTPIVPVIVILDSQKLSNFLQIGPFPFEPNANRLAKTNSIATGGWLELPIIVYNGAAISFIDGRHRTTSLTAAGIATIPFLTADPMKQTLLNAFGGPKAIALSTYSFVSCNNYAIYGI